MFSWLSSQSVRSDLGFEVDVNNRFEMEYRENGRKMAVRVEQGYTDAMRPCVIVESAAFSFWTDREPREVVSTDERQRIIDNFKDAVKFQGLAVAVDGRWEG